MTCAMHFFLLCGEKLYITDYIIRARKAKVKSFGVDRTLQKNIFSQ